MRRPGEFARALPAARVQGISPVQAKATESIPPISGARWLQKGLAGKGLRHRHRRGAQDPGKRPPGRPETADVVRPGSNEDGRVINDNLLYPCAFITPDAV